MLEIFTCLYYANEKSDHVIGGSTETAQHSIETVNSRNIKAVIFKLGTSNNEGTSVKKYNNTYRDVATTTVMPVMLSTPKTIWEPCVFRVKPSGPLQKVANGDIWFFTERERNWS